MACCTLYTIYLLDHDLTSSLRPVVSPHAVPALTHDRIAHRWMLSGRSGSSQDHIDGEALSRGQAPFRLSSITPQKSASRMKGEVYSTLGCGARKQVDSLAIESKYVAYSQPGPGLVCIYVAVVYWCIRGCVVYGVRDRDVQ